MKHSTKKILSVAWLACCAGLAGLALAQGHAGHTAVAQAKGAAKAMTEAADGEVRRVDRAAGKVTLRHGDLRELEMPPMTMVFEVRDKAILDTVKQGDKVKFKAIDDNGKLIVIEMKPAS